MSEEWNNDSEKNENQANAPVIEQENDINIETISSDDNDTTTYDKTVNSEEPEMTIEDIDRDESANEDETEAEDETVIVMDLSVINESVLSKLIEIDERLASMDKKFETKILRSEKEGTVIDKMHEELQLYKNDLYTQLVKPILMDIITVREHILKLSSDISNLPDEEQHVPLKTFSSFANDLFRILEDNEIEVLSFSEGDEYTPIKQKIVDKRKTDDPKLHKTIAATFGDGYCYRGKPLVAQKVIVFAFEPESSQENKE